MIAGWFFAGVLLLLAAGPIMSAFTILAVPAGTGALAVYALATVAVFLVVIRSAIAVPTLGSWGLVCSVPAVVALLFFGSHTIAWTGLRAFSHMRFALLFPVYSSFVSGLNESPPGQRVGRVAFVRYEVEPGPPARVVFPHCGGITDNWTGTVYDPTDEVEKVQDWKDTGDTREFTGHKAIEGLFGGDIVSCSRRLGHDFFCVFTQAWLVTRPATFRLGDAS